MRNIGKCGFSRPEFVNKLLTLTANRDRKAMSMDSK